MTDHVHEWLVILDTGTVVCNGCEGYGQMPVEEVARRLNATERLNGLDARIMGSVGAAGLKDKALEMLLSYAAALEGDV